MTFCSSVSVQFAQLHLSLCYSHLIMLTHRELCLNSKVNVRKELDAGRSCPALAAEFSLKDNNILHKKESGLNH